MCSMLKDFCEVINFASYGKKVLEFAFFVRQRADWHKVVITSKVLKITVYANKCFRMVPKVFDGLKK